MFNAAQRRWLERRCRCALADPRRGARPRDDVDGIVETPAEQFDTFWDGLAGPVVDSIVLE